MSNNTSDYHEIRHLKYMVYSVFIPFLVTLCLVAIASNLYILFLIRWVRKTQNLNPTLLITLSLAAADVYASSILVIGMINNSYLPVVCSIILFDSYCPSFVIEAFRLGGILTSILHLVLLSMNHLFATCYPLSYRSIFTVSRIKWFIIGLWIFPPLVFLTVFGGFPGDGFQSPRCTSYERFEKLAFRVTLLISFLVPLMLMCLVYLKICASLAEQSRKMKRQQELNRRPCMSLERSGITDISPAPGSAIDNSDNICGNNETRFRHSSRYNKMDWALLRRLTGARKNSHARRCTNARMSEHLQGTENPHFQNGIPQGSENGLSGQNAIHLTAIKNKPETDKNTKGQPQPHNQQQQQQIGLVKISIQSADNAASAGRNFDCTTINRSNGCSINTNDPSQKSSNDESHLASIDVRSNLLQHRGSMSRTQEIGRPNTPSNCHRQPQAMLRKRRTVITALVIVGTFMVCWLPASLFPVIMCPAPDCLIVVDYSTTLITMIVANSLMILKGVCNPLIYSARMPEIKKAIKASHTAFLSLKPAVSQRFNSNQSPSTRATSSRRPKGTPETSIRALPRLIVPPSNTSTPIPAIATIECSSHTALQVTTSGRCEKSGKEKMVNGMISISNTSVAL